MLEALRVGRRVEHRLERRYQAATCDLARLVGLDQDLESAQLLLAQHAQVGRGNSELSVRDWVSGEVRVVPIQPSLSVREATEQIFARAKRLRSAERKMRERVERTATELAEVRQWLQAAQRHKELLCEEGLPVDANPEAEVARWVQLEHEAVKLRILQGQAEQGFRRELQTGNGAAPRGAIRDRPPLRLPYRTFQGAGDRPILVGRTAADNDTLTLHVAKPQDLFLHVRESPGAHVIVPLRRGETVPADLLIDAAHLAVYYSELRGALRADVAMCLRRYLRKPRKSAAGAVLLGREKVLQLRVDATKLAQLLAQLEAGPGA
jgi:predicted ribosome quality control (RQC) complex YloA/Tae2 family protein